MIYNIKNLKRLKKLIIFLFIILIVVVYCIIQNNCIKIEEITINSNDIPEEFNGFRIIHLSDTHFPKNASNAKSILNLVEKQNPDIILFTGDTLDKSAVIETCGLEEFCKGLSEICDVYAVSGNHERWDKHSEKWKQMLKDNNIKLLRDEYIKIERNGQELVLMGLIDNTSYNPDIFENIEEISDSYKILLAHRPELWQTYCSDSYEIRPDLIFSGHAHGGQFVIPFIGGVVAPSQEYFPKYTSGLYELDNGVKMIVSRGLGNSVIPIRINNRPHIPVIILGKE